jgi:transcriptional regulator with XRE-family HTH domain
MAARIKKQGPLRRHYITEWRELRGLSKADLAKRINTTKTTITALEQGGAYTQHSLEVIGEALKVDPAWLILAPPSELYDTILKTLRDTDFTLRFQEPSTPGRPRRRQNGSA